MISPRTFRRALFALLSSAALMVACGDNPSIPIPSIGGGPKPVATTPPVVDAGLPPRVTVEYTENDFIESERNRDPFRSFARTFVDQGRKTTINQRNVLLNEFSISDLKLVGIVLGSEPRAMLLDPTGKGWVVKRGDFVGRPDVIHAGGANGTDFQINWKVDRIRDGDLVLIREDPANPGAQPATQVIPLHPEAEGRTKG